MSIDIKFLEIIDEAKKNMIDKGFSCEVEGCNEYPDLVVQVFIGDKVAAMGMHCEEHSNEFRETLQEKE